jgi:hypothetical protein
MTSLRDRPNTALLVTDVQNDVVASAYQRDEVIENRLRNEPSIFACHDPRKRSRRGRHVRVRRVQV